mgnify:CR=1 FL=1
MLLILLLLECLKYKKTLFSKSPHERIRAGAGLSVINRCLSRTQPITLRTAEYVTRLVYPELSRRARWCERRNPFRWGRSRLLDYSQCLLLQISFQNISFRINFFPHFNFISIVWNFIVSRVYIYRINTYSIFPIFDFGFDFNFRMWAVQYL